MLGRNFMARGKALFQPATQVDQPQLQGDLRLEFDRAHFIGFVGQAEHGLHGLLMRVPDDIMDRFAPFGREGWIIRVSETERRDQVQYAAHPAVHGAVENLFFPGL